MKVHQIDCFKINIKFWKFLAIWPCDSSRFYNYYSKVFILVFICIYDILFTINFYFLPRKLDVIIESLIFYFTELAVTSKVLTFLFMYQKIKDLLEMLENETFQPKHAEGFAIVEKAKKFYISYWKIVAAVSYTSYFTHILAPMILHITMGVPLVLPVCSYSFIPENIKGMFVYPLYFYQCFGMHFHMMYNVNIDSFILGLMVLAIAQLDILDGKLRRVTEYDGIIINEENNTIEKEEIDRNAVTKLNECILHYREIYKFCSLIEEVFSMTLFIQFGLGSCIICVCLFRFTLAAPLSYYIFLATYMVVMILQILVPCWFGTKIMHKQSVEKFYRIIIYLNSTQLAFAIYNCDWTPRSRQFKSNLRLFVERVNRPLSIIGGKMFCLSLDTFTSIMNSAYSFYTLLQHMQSRD